MDILLGWCLVTFIIGVFIGYATWGKPKYKIKVTDPKVGEKWFLRGDDGDPFGANHDPVLILEVKEGWVRYKMSRLFDDNRKPISDFIVMYTLVNEDL